MQSLYKYLPTEHADSFVHKGEVLFRPLSYFRDYEDAEVRGDQFEGTKLHRPKQGLEITMTKTQEKITLPHSFESVASENEIFVFCLSTVLSPSMAVEFKTNSCIEIHQPARFISEIRAALLRRPSIKNKTLVHGEVHYYAKEDPPIVDWALPERIAMSKLSAYASQHEYRIAFSINNAFSVGNTRLRLVTPIERHLPRTIFHPEHLLKLGNLAKLCRVHHLSETNAMRFAD